MSYHVNPGPNATFSSTQTQRITDVTLGQAITLNTTEVASGITLVNSTRMVLPQAGDYLFSFSAICEVSTGSNKDISIWFRYNGVDVPRSNTNLKITSGNPQIMALSFIFPCATPGDYYEMYMAGDTTNCGILATPAVVAPSTPVQPAVPSMVIAIVQVR